ncbi:hypothetical protein MXB_2019, partial [Myxobolus squamalis]
MSNDLSFDGDSDDYPEIDRGQLEENFIFDAASHIVLSEEPKMEIDTEKEEIFEPKTFSPPELNEIDGLHNEVSGFLAPVLPDTPVIMEHEEIKQDFSPENSEEKDSDSRSIYIGN